MVLIYYINNSYYKEHFNINLKYYRCTLKKIGTINNEIFRENNIKQDNLALVDKISDGRITNIKIDKTVIIGNGLNLIFANLDKPPNIKIKNYIINKNE